MHLRARWKRVFSLGFGLVTVLLLIRTYALDERKPAVVTNVVLIGATGDLAKKYLWQGFFNLFMDIQQGSHHVHFYSAAREGYQEGSKQLKRILEDHISCLDEDCEDSMQVFEEQVKYVQLKTSDDYRDLCQNLNDGIPSEDGRLFYLSVPPFAYPQIVEYIDTVCRPPDPGTWLRVVLEKPFGHDLTSAQALAAKLSEHLREEEIYRIDHYLGKPGVRTILPFRAANHELLDRIWNHKHIEYVEIAMKETVDVKGRINFYDKYGVIRDVMQNHLSEVLSLVAMEMPRDLTPASIQQSKIHLFKEILPVTASQTVIGQYGSYLHEWTEETRQNPGNVTLTPTFAASTVFINNYRWRGVPFVLMSGKRLLEKLSYVKVVFKNRAVCPSSVSWDREADCEVKQIIFILSQSDTDSKYPHILVSKGLMWPKLPDAIFEEEATSGHEFQIFSKSVSEYHVFSTREEDAYTTLIESCYHGDRSDFVDTDRLMASWVIWNNVLKELKGQKPRIYTPEQTETGWLNFEVRGQNLEYTFQEIAIEEESFHSSLSSSYESGAASFRGQPLFRGETGAVLDELARFIYDNAVNAIADRGSFHIALSGGKSPRPLFAKLSKNFQEVFPWTHTHIWMVDERCVARSDQRSNFKGLQDYLLENIAIPHYNVHPMPTELVHGLCEPDDNGPKIYTAEMARSLEMGRLDYILLGVGSDGHAASLFPRSPSLNETSRQVVLTAGGPEDGVPRRMSLTYAAINKARNIGVLILGADKRDIVHTLANQEKTTSYNQYPILGVKPLNGSLEWYIDDEALGGLGV